MRRQVLASLLVLAAAPAPRAVAAAPVVAVLSSDLPAYQEALRGFTAGFGENVPVIAAATPAALPAGTKVVAAFGSRASVGSYPPGVLVVSCLTPGLPGMPQAGTRVRMVPPPEKLLAGLRANQPRLRVLAVLWISGGFADYARALRQEGRPLGIKVVYADLDEEGELPERLRTLRGGIDALWLAPDPELVNERTFSVLRHFARSTRLPLYVPTAELVKEGATGAVAVSFYESGRTAGLVVRRALAGEALPARIYPEKVEAVFDGIQAARRGLTLSTGALELGVDGRRPPQ